jgi:carbamoylphosphate synthase large subunit
MKVDIQFQKYTDVDAPCCAKTEVMGEGIVAIGRTWEEAEARLLAKVESWLNASVPAPKTVEVKSKDEDMDTELLPWEDAPGRTIEAGTV